jgi:hypothetical protein
MFTKQALVMMAVAAIGYGQSGTATITGSIFDPSGAAVNGATVTITDAGTGFTRATTSNATGNYNLPGLRPGVYSVQVENPGFRRYQQTDFRVEVDQTARLDVQLQLGQTSEVIEVRATAQLLHTENATVGAVIDTKKIVELPLNGRNFVQLALLIPGVTPGQPGAGSGGGISIGGARSEQNAFQLDGVSNSDQWNSGITFTPSIDAIQEFKIEVNNYSAEFGKGAGGQINVVTKSGTNKLTGSLWEFHRPVHCPALHTEPVRGGGRGPRREGPHLLLRVLRGISKRSRHNWPALRTGRYDARWQLRTEPRRESGDGRFRAGRFCQPDFRRQDVPAGVRPTAQPECLCPRSVPRERYPVQSLRPHRRQDPARRLLAGAEHARRSRQPDRQSHSELCRRTQQPK